MEIILKKVLFEFGGNVLFVIFKDVDIDVVVVGVIFCKFCFLG